MPSPSVVNRATAKLIRLQARVSCKFAAPFGRDLNPERWIFVVGCYNSGTSLLADILTRHEQIGGLPNEGIYFTDSLPMPEWYGWPRMWTRCLDKVRLEPGDLDDAAVRRIKRQWSIYYPRHTPNLVEKSPPNATRMPFLQAHFKPAYFIAITRDGYAVAEGIRRRVVPRRWGNREYGDRYPIELCAEQWRASDEIIERDQAQLERFLALSYEQLTAEPANTLRRVTDFLGVDPMPANVFDADWSVRDKQEPIQNMNHRSFERLSEADLDAIERVAGDRLARHGYARPEPAQPAPAAG